MCKTEIIDMLKNSEEFAEIDRHFARFICSRESDENQLLFILTALASRATREGNICINLEQLAHRELLPDSDNSFIMPSLEKMLDALKASKHTGQPGEFKPLILDSKNRLYLFRYWKYENDLAQKIKILSSTAMPDIDYNKLEQGLNRLFGRNKTGEFDYQVLAAFSAAYSRISVITGGPGTGKTSTVVKILALLIEQYPGMKIALAAPTGKAAARLQESIQNSITGLNCDETIKDIIPRQASTIHRLLGSIRNSPYFRYNNNNPLPHDLIIVDEASMVDLPMLAKLTTALGNNTRLILLGDKDQLASVEAGAALGDICKITDRYSNTEKFANSFNRMTKTAIPQISEKLPESKLSDCIVELKKSYRFGEKSGIGMLSRAVNESDHNKAVETLQSGAYDDLKWLQLPSKEQLFELLKERIINHYAKYLKSEDPRTALSAFNDYQILCAVREGPYGVVSLNKLIERILAQADIIQPISDWYRGRPIMILRNDYQLELYNGDIGITLPDVDDPGDLKVYFPARDNSIRKFSPVRLPAHEDVYAMTIHKSQGSEFRNALAILPDSQSPILTRELIYTGITRARSSLELWCNDDILEYCIQHRVHRESGLLDKII